MPDLPAAALLAAWGAAALAGECSLDEAAAAVAAPADPPHRVAGLPGEDGPVSLPYALGRLRGLGAAGLRLVLPRPGDVSGLPGPAGFNRSALEAGAAVVAVGAGLALLPAGRAAWRAYAVADDARSWLTGPEADRALTAAVREAAEALADLDVARWDPRVAALQAETAAARLPSGRALAARAVRLLAVVEVALDGEGGAVSAAQLAARREALQAVADAARRAVEAACSSPAP